MSLDWVTDKAGCDGFQFKRLTRNFYRFTLIFVCNSAYGYFMFSRVSLLAFAGIALAWPHVAAAADIKRNTYAPQYHSVPQAPAFTWQGTYFGAHGSLFRGFQGGSASSKNSELAGGLQVGYNHAVTGSSLTSVFGAELGGTYLGQQSARDRNAGIPEQRWLATGKLRYGLAFDRALLFAVGGVATTQVTNHGVNRSSRDKWEMGYVVGGGLEYAVTDSLSVKGEYNYVSFGDWKGTDSLGKAAKGELTNHLATVGVNYRF